MKDMKLEAKIVIGLLVVLIAVLAVGISRMGNHQPAEQASEPAGPSTADLFAAYEAAKAEFDGAVQAERKAIERFDLYQRLQSESSKDDPEGLAKMGEAVDSATQRRIELGLRKDEALRRVKRK